MRISEGRVLARKYLHTPNARIVIQRHRKPPRRIKLRHKVYISHRRLRTETEALIADERLNGRKACPTQAAIQAAISGSERSNTFRR